MENGDKTEKQKGEFPNRATQFSSTFQPENNGRPKGSISLKTRIQKILDGEVELPDNVKEAIIKAAGEGKKPLDAMVIVGVLKAIAGDSAYFKSILEFGFDKPTQRNDNTHSGPDGGPMTLTWLDKK